MKIKQHLGFISMLAIAFTACQQKPAETDNFLENEIKNIEAQHTLQTDLIEKSGKILNPRTIDEKGNIVYVPIDDWTSGFFPGTMWLDYDLTKDEKWKNWLKIYRRPGLCEIPEMASRCRLHDWMQLPDRIPFVQET